MAELTPPDYEQCQAEVGGAFQIGGVRQRCNSKKPKWLAIENKPGKDGQKGSMTLCDVCRLAFDQMMPKGFATIIEITEDHRTMRRVNEILRESEDARLVATYFLRRTAGEIRRCTGDPFTCREEWETKAASFEERADQIERGENLK